MDNDTIAQARRAGMRWLILLVLNNARPTSYSLRPVFDVVQSQYPDVSRQELCAELDYLEKRELVQIARRPDGDWSCSLTRYGIDMAEYTIDCEPGIARPSKTFWGA